MNSQTPRSTGKDIAALIGWIVLTFTAPVFGVLGKPGAWFASLVKPSFNPPSWVFGPVWSLLYLMMAVAAWRVWRRGGRDAPARPLHWFLTQLVLNAAWTPVFFGLHRIGSALVIIVLLWFAILMTLLAFRKTDRAAAAMLVPYLAWVSFASALNFAFWRLNP